MTQEELNSLDPKSFAFAEVIVKMKEGRISEPLLRSLITITGKKRYLVIWALYASLDLKSEFMEYDSLKNIVSDYDARKLRSEREQEYGYEYPSNTCLYLTFDMAKKQTIKHERFESIHFENQEWEWTLVDKA